MRYNVTGMKGLHILADERRTKIEHVLQYLVLFR